GQRTGEFGNKVEEGSSFTQQESETAREADAEQQAQPAEGVGEETALGAQGGLPADREDATSGEPGNKVREAASSLQEDHSPEEQGGKEVAEFGYRTGSVLPFRQQQSAPVKEQSAEQAEPGQGMGERQSLGEQDGLSAGKEDRTASETGNGVQEITSPLPQTGIAEEPVNAKADCPDELEIHGCRIKIDFPEDLLKRSKSSTVEYRYKMAGVLAAEALKNNSQLITSYTVDPVPIWQEIRDYVMTRFNQAELR
ncbi:MAG: hypothetical protein ACYC5X_12410, partial [Syntrophales bacterium]